MVHSEFLKDYYNLQLQIMFDELIPLEHGVVGYSSNSSSFFWNNALISDQPSYEELRLIENVLHEHKRDAVVYFENMENSQALGSFLEEYGYKFLAEDCWMSYRGETVASEVFSSAKVVADEQELRVFLDVFNKCYKNDDPQNPYGELGEYLDVAATRWVATRGKRDLEYVLVYDYKEPVAVAALTSWNGIGYISNVGSLKKVRGLGFGKIASLYCVALSQEKQNTIHCLATENGTYPHEFYKRIGFEKEFNCFYYGKSS